MPAITDSRNLTRQRIGLTMLGAALSMTLWTSIAQASPVGTWKTEADKKGQTALVEAKPCGAGLCGTMVEVFDASGNQINHPNVGKRLFWDMVPSGDAYEGRAYVPALNLEVNGTLKINGDTMKVGGCAGPVCQSQTWRRVD
ncbi:DUF2147 domain-containing protein [Pseudosulfitobacter koreensis]|uniref:DUF2147 domain-containing protein n=1 Tax=Pseudosulfitobacter koreensis TaxID=2968472 RepID=A0ABT1YZM4_9RHOB|nr:DUF2147 domain-containing protein [Pseudosulfitobacter koreense]MCR8826334.1 DUF2147 domain-containing protein [Pseudosulfitobacter koreense]